MFNTPGNWVAVLFLVLWPLLSLYLFRVKSTQYATILIMLGGFMWLPVRTAIDFPFIPPLGKDTIPALSAFIAIWHIKKIKLTFFDKDRAIKLLLLMLIFGPLFTAITNEKPLVFLDRHIFGLSLYDGVSMMIGETLLILPFIIGRQFFRSYESQLLLFKLLVIMGLIYSVLMLFEVRMSPQLHRMMYGFFPHSFAQQWRDGGFRPVVFMGHGLLVSFFTVIVLIAAAALWEIKVKIRNISEKVTHHYLLFVLVLCKSTASLMYGFFSVLLLKTTSPNTQHKAAILLVSLALLYPVLSTFKLFPHQEIVNIAENISPYRAQSLEFRFDNEEILLAHAREHIFLGWGGWGRNRARSEETGADLSVTDGRWIIKLGVFGVVGFIAEFGLLAMSVFRAKQASRLLTDKKEKTILAAHALMVSIVMIDQLPNASLAPWIWLIAGILLGRSEEILTKNNAKQIKVIN